MKTIRKRFGFDLDNTLIDYSESVKMYCRLNGFEVNNNLKSLRVQLKKRDSSDKTWQMAQSWIYTSGLQFAKLTSGCLELFAYLNQRGMELFIVSHKSSKTPKFTGALELRDLCSNWVRESKLKEFFPEDTSVFFEPTRDSKVGRIKELSLNYFVDDLEEVFTHPNFPTCTKKFLIFQNESNDPNIFCIENILDIREKI